MWTISKVRTGIGDREAAAAAARYVLEAGESPLAFSPAGGDGAEVGPLAYWLGSEGALGKLGLKPGQEVSQADFELGLQGRHVNGSQVRRPGFIERPLRGPDGKMLRDADGEVVTERELGVVTFKFTYSAPKSVSTLWSQASEEEKRKIERDMFESWNLGVEHLIASHDVVMHGRDETGERHYGPAAGYAAAVSLHATARRAEGDPAPAPQLHIEGTVIGLTRNDGKLVAINAAAIYGDPALEAGAYARAHQAERLVEMGYGIRSSTGRDGLYFEVRGVPQELIDDFSGRSREVEGAAREEEALLGRELTNRERAKLALKTRAPKEAGKDPAKTVEWWKERCRDRGFTRERAAEIREELGFELGPEEAHTSLAAAVEKSMRSRGPVVSQTAANALVMAAAPGRMRVAEAEEMVRALQAEGALMALEESWVTSPSIRAAEKRVMEILEGVGERPPEPYSPEALAAGEAYANQRLGEGRELSDQQHDAIAKLGAGAGFSILSAPAGAGKTAVLQALTEAHRQAGGTVIACAINWRTAQELAEDLEAQPFSIRRATRWAADGRLAVDEKTLIVVEEAGKVGLPQWKALAELVEKSGARLLGAGHAAQMGAVELPGMFEEMVSRPGLVSLAHLTDNKRPNHEWMRDLQVAVLAGQGKEAVRILLENHAITFYSTHAEAVEGTVARWFASQKKHGAELASMIIEGSNLEIDETNAEAQERRLEAGELTGEALAAPGRPYDFYAGDQVVLRGAAYWFDRGADGVRERALENGTAGVVRATDPEGKRMWVEVEEPGHPARVVEVDLGRSYERAEPERQDAELTKGLEEDFGPPSFRLSYAIHPNFSQGMGIWSVGHLGGHPAQDRESSYVSLSRPIEELHDHVNCERFRGETVEEWMAEYAKILATSRRRHASIRYEEAPEQKIANARSAGCHVLPEDLYAKFGAPQLEAPAPATRTLSDLIDPLAPHRGALGAERAKWIEERAEGYRGVVAKMPEHILEAEHGKAQKAFKHLDHKGALATLGLQRDRHAAEQEIKQARHFAESLEFRAEKTEDSEERKALLEVAETQRHLAAEELTDRRELLAQEQELRQAGVHLDDWMADHGDLAARYVALERKLFADREEALKAGIEETIAAALEGRQDHEQAERIQTVLGPAPGEGEPQREEWRELARELEVNRLIETGELPAGEPSARELAELELRVQQLRADRGLEAGFERGGSVEELGPT